MTRALVAETGLSDSPTTDLVKMANMLVDQLYDVKMADLEPQSIVINNVV